MKANVIRDINLAPGGRLKIDWVREHMPVLNAIRKEFERDKPFKGVRVALSIHLEAKTAYLAEVMKAGGPMCPLPAPTRFPPRMTWRRRWRPGV